MLIDPFARMTFSWAPTLVTPVTLYATACAQKAPKTNGRVSPKVRMDKLAKSTATSASIKYLKIVTQCWPQIKRIIFWQNGASFAAGSALAVAASGLPNVSSREQDQHDLYVRQGPGESPAHPS
jgi:hypothetical protein